MAKGSIPDKDITASSELDSDSSASNARLGNTKAWIPRSNDQHPWIQVNLQYRRNLTAIVTQGFNGSFVKSYYVSYGDDGNNWTNYTVQGTIRVNKKYLLLLIKTSSIVDHQCIILLFRVQSIY